MGEFQFDLIVVGSGIAGISTVYHLINECNFNGRIVLLEARDRIGGRIHGVTIGDRHVELGANWIHGLINNPIYALALKYHLLDPVTPGLTLTSNEDNRMKGVLSSGVEIPFDVIEEVYKTYFTVLKKAETLYERSVNGEEVNELEYQDNVACYIQREIDDYLLLNCSDDTSVERSIFNQLLNRETVISGCDNMSEVSLKYFGAYKELPGGYLTIPSGYTQILSGLLSDINNKLKSLRSEGCFDLRLNHEVVKIHWSGVGEANNELAHVECANGNLFTAKHVVVTVPLGVLKNKVHSLFEPQLPQPKLDSIKSLGFGVVNKIYLQYKTQLSAQHWDSELDELLCCWTEHEGNEWYTKVYSFMKVGERCLLAWLSGKEAETGENLDENEISTQLTKWLRIFSNNPDFPEPESIHITKWRSDQFARGSYTYIATNSSTKDIETLSEPIYTGSEKPQILFAGEACHPRFFSTVHGAFISGRKAAFCLQGIKDDKDDE